MLEYFIEREYTVIMDIYKTIRKELLKSEKTRYAIWKESGISEQILWKVYHSEQPCISLKNAEDLLEYFGYELQKRGK
ncbi:hypothetical protein [Sedimentisphaera salicampi]|uniref:HTH cro/C1-type domain-containing protein n=1 Tax=Sedimentisphaera salicampi TaxID=1941349 RepID=A0A1W6LL83_9BACT|nr:hypothetical protein [Sedimentisphaera salicampi]ARN56516.1 hypothetical protein STSP1_00899 [Sedimentisphaera salicampi]